MLLINHIFNMSLLKHTFFNKIGFFFFYFLNYYFFMKKFLKNKKLLFKIKKHFKKESMLLFPIFTCLHFLGIFFRAS
jgi:hypothetical protein